ncbi:MAG: DNA polymerase III subunit delta' [Planctomycetia bacterium 21-64-5]|nr:MAG: DNA polymerase III subunit delta' [Planctomycetia bacterium 21-64-5]HQU42207.1 DNA polymerase III subunit delta' [Pirellulales bacterium]
MSWQGIEGHDDVVEQFRRTLGRGRLASTYLFVGPNGVGKHAFAHKLAQTLLCQTNPPERLEPCGHCASCQQVQAGTHPDLIVVAKPDEKSEIPVQLLIGSGDRRMREGLCHDISLKPFMGGRRVAIIDDADYLNEEGANCLLKTLEEPPPRSVIILVSSSVDRQLPTIRSRSQIIRFAPLADDVVASLLLSQGVAADHEEAQRLATYSEGSLARARELAGAELWKFRAELVSRLAEAQFDSVRLAKAVLAFVDEAGKEAPPRRARARRIVTFAAEFYRQLVRRLTGVSPTGDAELAKAVEIAATNWPAGGEDAVACVERCFDALAHIDRNANQAIWIECWVDDLSRLIARKAA